MISQRHKILLNNDINLDYLEKVASDICRPISPKTYNNYRYFITFIDKKTRFLSIKLLKHKNDALKAFIEFKALAENNKNNKKIYIFISDNKKEYINTDFKNILKKYNILY